MPAKSRKKVPKNLYENTYLVMPMVVEKECSLFELKEDLKLYGFKYSDEILIKYLTSQYFRKRLETYLKFLEDDTNPEYFIELYTYP